MCYAQMHMIRPHIYTLSATMALLTVLAIPSAYAQSRPVGGGARITFPSHAHNFSWEGRHGFHNGFGGGFGGVWVVEQEVPVVVEREVVREVPAPPAAVASPAPARKPYAIGSTYASLPDSCMKLIEDGVSYYYCSDGEWYRQVGKQYRAVERKL